MAKAYDKWVEGRGLEYGSEQEALACEVWNAALEAAQEELKKADHYDAAKILVYMEA